MNLTQIELEHLRHLIGFHDVSSRKCAFYAEQCTDPELKQKFQESAQSAKQTYQNLLTFLN